MGRLPFIVEGELFAQDGSCSLSIRWVGGAYVIGLVAWSEGASVETEAQGYLMHASDRTLQFLQAWEAQADPLCDGMEVLRPTWRAFVGFEMCKSNNKEQR